MLLYQKHPRVSVPSIRLQLFITSHIITLQFLITKHTKNAFQIICNIICPLTHLQDINTEGSHWI